MTTGVTTSVAGREVHIPDDHIIREKCKRSFWHFVSEFWECVPGAGKMKPSWHMEYLANILQEIAERVFRGEPALFDLVVNIAPGSSKSSLASILFHPWTWTRMPHGRHINASHTESLVLDLANKSREVVNSEKYRRLFPGIEMRQDQNSKQYFINEQGGSRYAATVGGKSPMGFHGHFLCFPYNEEVTTDAGRLPVGKIVEENLQVKVLGYEHAGKGHVWTDIISRGYLPGRPLCRVSLSDGTCLEATFDHPVYVKGKGYVEASELSYGDEVIHDGRMHFVRQGEVQQSGTRSEDQVRQAVLLSRLSGQVHDRQQSPSFQHRQEKLSGMWQGDGGPRRSEGREEVLQQKMLWTVREGREKSVRSTASRYQMRLLWGDVSETAQPAFQEQLLLQGMCKQRTLDSDGGQRELQLQGRMLLRGLPERVSRDQGSCAQKRSTQVLELSYDEEEKREEYGRSSHRLEQEEQLDGQLDLPLHVLSCKLDREGDHDEKTSKLFVVSVNKTSWIPDKVYNLGVAETNNYFVNGILVHNTGDDLIDPEKVLSDVERETAANFISNTLPTRMVDKEVSVVILIMQRLGLGDPTDVMVEIGRREGARPVRRICLPAELTDKIYPTELRENYVDGLMDPVRMPRKVLDDQRARNRFKYASQFLQDPQALGGGLFREGYFSKRIRQAPYDSMRIRFWDRASGTEDGSCFTAGVLLAKDKNRTY